MSNDVLACVDMSELSASLVRLAAEIARQSGGQLHVIHVAEGEPALVGFDPPGGVHDLADHAVVLEHERIALDALVDAALSGIEASRLVVAGPTVDAILEIADGIEPAMIVVGRGSHGRLMTAILGSVSGDLVRRSRRPVLVVPSGG